MQPYISLVIPTYNRVAMLFRVLDAFVTQEGPPDFEVVLVDDGSSDGTSERVREGQDRGRWPFPLRLVPQENGGPGRARNHGVSIATGKFILFIGDDTVPERSFLAEHARVHRDSGDDPWLACLGYTGWPDDEQATAFMEYINDYGLQFGYRLIEHDSIVPFNFFYTSNISLSREVLAKHPFDTSFPAAAWEDIELAYRLDHLGLRIRYDAHAVTRHHHPMSIDTFARRQYTVGRSGVIFFSKHPELSHFLGVEEARSRPPAGDRTMTWLTFRAHLGERFRVAASCAVFERLMREHYLRGIREGLRRLESQVE